uniref:Palladin-like n=1 Tax=Ciona intestinalis TaxID=7719 RepID=H2XKB3_CIOIN|nr:palladin-like [Ciona intestinalis]|eukprot:XP_002127748.1 palladin-like [Ciona intestinalis]
MSMVVTMTGGSPWGFKMTGGKDFRLPLAIGKVKAGGKASKCGVVEGYWIEKVNGEDFTNLGHHEAQNKIKSAGATLVMELCKPKSKPPPQPTVTSLPTNNQTKATPQVTYQPGEHRYNKYSAESDWQKSHQSQSPAMQKAYHKSVKAPLLTEAPAFTITPEIKELILEDEKTTESGLKASEVKTWQSQNGSTTPTPSPVPPPVPSNGNHSRAAANIGKFIKGPGANSYGEPDFTKPLQDISAPLGEPAVLEVRIAPILPTPSVHWYHNNKPARESKEKDIRFLCNGPVHTLVLGELSNETLGMYTCTIMNKHGTKSSRCNVTVKNDGQKIQNRKPTVYIPPNQTQAPKQDSKRVIPSTSLGLYSSRNVQESYDGQVNRPQQRKNSEESEVMRALREEDDDVTKQTRQTRAIKYLEQTLLPESDDL